jgi:carboxylesterase type B
VGQETVEVHIEPGLVRGVKSKYGHWFYGIPYARAGRFEVPRKPEPWHPKVLDATHARPSCIRMNGPDVYTGTAEDCQHVHVYAPIQVEGQKRPVVVWIHGGSYTKGAGSDTFPEHVRQLVENDRCVVTTLNYRLGVFGFLASDRGRTPGSTTGNWGTLDQQFAMQWVQDNILSFGGNPKSVALMGWSAGAASISVHLAMESSKGLFSRAIMLSGGFTDWAAIDMESNEKLYDAVIQKVGCDKDPHCQSPGPICSCLKNMDAEVLVRAQASWGWGPTIDGVELPMHPMHALRRGKVHKGVPVIIGGAREDTMHDIGSNASEQLFKEDLKRLSLPESVGDLYLNDDMKEQLYTDANAAYRKGWSAAYWAARRVQADRTMNCPAREAASLWQQASGAPAFWYLWDAASPLIHPTAPQPTPNSLHVVTCWPCPGAGHGSDQSFIFETPDLNINDAIANLADMYQAFIKDMADRGNPNLWNGFHLALRQPGERAKDAWARYDGTSRGAMYFLPRGTRYVEHLKEAECAVLPSIP